MLINFDNYKRVIIGFTCRRKRDATKTLQNDSVLICIKKKYENVIFLLHYSYIIY